MSHHDVDPVVDPIGALRAELSRVEVSPEFAERVRRQIGDDVMASIGAELSELSVSPAFAVRVRQQIEAAPARPRWFGVFSWRWAVPVAAGAVIAAIVLTRGGAPTATVDPAVMQAVASTQQVLPVQQSTQPSEVAPIAQLPHAEAARVTQRTSANAAASSEQAEDKLEVITNQPAILRQLWAAAVATVEVAEAPREMREIVIVPVEVTPVAVQWLVEPPPSGGVTPAIRRVSADAERSDK